MHARLCGDWILGTAYGTAYLCRFLGSGLSASEQLLSQIKTAMVLPLLSFNVSSIEDPLALQLCHCSRTGPSQDGRLNCRVCHDIV